MDNHRQKYYRKTVCYRPSALKVIYFPLVDEQGQETGYHIPQFCLDEGRKLSEEESKHWKFSLRAISFLLNFPENATAKKVMENIRHKKTLLSIAKRLKAAVPEVLNAELLRATQEQDFSSIRSLDLQLFALKEASYFALSSCVSAGDGECLQMLRGGPNAAPEFGDAPLHRAARAGHVACVTQLLSSGADVQARDWFGHTPLHDAVSWGRRDVEQLLLLAGADPQSKDWLGLIPVQLRPEREVRPEDLDAFARVHGLERTAF